MSKDAQHPIDQTATRSEASAMNAAAEWLETDGLGGYAMGRADGVRTRRYHALLTVARTPPTERLTLISGVDVWLDTSDGQFALSTQQYCDGVLSPDGVKRLVDFSTAPWPTWRYRLPNGIEVTQEFLMRHGSPLVMFAWRLSKPIDAQLVVRPFFAMRDPHALTHANGAFDWRVIVEGSRLDWRPYDGLPGVTAVTTGVFAPDPHWYRNFEYEDDRTRGLDYIEDLASPGTLRFTLGSGDDALLAFRSDREGSSAIAIDNPRELWETVSRQERERRATFQTPLHFAADAFVVQRGEGRTVIAGYPWFTDWGRDTFIALRGLCLATGRHDDARAILLEWARHVRDGLLPNRFPDFGKAPEYNSVDAALWYCVAVELFLRATESNGSVRRDDRQALGDAVMAIVEGYRLGTHYGIREDEDGLLAAGVPGVQLTWMDAKVGKWVVTPRVGKPVEIQALWINALRVASRWDATLAAAAERVTTVFECRFWNDTTKCMHDVVDVDGHLGQVDPSVRPNQLFAVGGLPWPVISGTMAGHIVNRVEAELWTDAGLRSLASHEVGYVGVYEGDVPHRDGAYHQGTVWPWLAGAFIDAWVRLRGGTTAAKRKATNRFLAPLIAHYGHAAPGFVGEIADGNAPHTPRGCPFQAWSVGEALWLQQVVLQCGRSNTSRSPTDLLKQATGRKRTAG